MNYDLLNLKFLSGSALKVIAVISMTIDHVALYVMAGHLGMQEYWLYDVLRGIGRLAFPIFAFLVVEGFRHTHNLKRYMVVLFMAAIISEIPWILLGQYDSHNVLFTLLLGLIAISMTDMILFNSLLKVVPLCIISPISAWLNTDYSWHGIGLMFVFFLFKDKPFLCFLFGFPLVMEYDIVGTACGILICLCYNGHRGFIKGEWLKYAFYLYYPLHLMAIWSLCVKT